MRSASHRYRRYRIKKRSGGWRTIDHPAAELKLLQSWLVENSLRYLPVHEAVYSYRVGIGIRHHAKIHQKKNYLLRVDFKDFFPSITGTDVDMLLKIQADSLPFPLSQEDRTIIRSIVCRKDRLTIGAPSSPLVSNAVMYEFDEHWFNESEKKNTVYSRYADDLFFSTNEPRVLEGLLEELRLDLKQRKSPRLRINAAKTVFTSRKRRRLVTGLVLTSDKQISLGRKKKRKIRGMVFRFIQNQLDAQEIAYLRGYLAFAQSVEPSFIHSLERKYGNDVVGQLKQATLVPRKR
ncbi:retron St85 family RNA-directed DNA polymerase [Acidobacteria bacterium AH-259-D05]|nr:retron St85 family RNA-directed DNA polymerase [Acidobacteria bacterium AH-259-D05]